MKKHLRGMAIGGFIVLLIAQTLGAVLSVSTFEKTFRESLESKYRILVGELRRQVERDVDFGRPIYLLGGVGKMFAAVLERDGNISALSVCQADGKVLYSTEPSSVGSRPAGMTDFPATRPAEGGEEYAVASVGDSNWASAPIRYGGEALVGMVRLRFEESVVTTRVKALYVENVRIILPIMLCATLLMVGLLIGGEAAAAKGRLHLPGAVRATLAVGITLLVAQASYAWLNDRQFERGYIALFEGNVDALGQVMKTDLDKVLGYGVAVERLNGADAFLERNRVRTREAESLAIVDPAGRTLYSAAAARTWSIFSAAPGSVAGKPVSIIQDEVRRVVPLGSGAAPKAYLVVNVNQKLIGERLREALLDVLTILAVSLVLGFELTRMLAVVMPGSTGAQGGSAATNEEAAAEAAAAEQRRSLQVVRVLAFVFFFAALIPLSFLPAFIEKIYLGNPVSILGLSRESIIGLPIAAYMLGVTIFIPLVGFLSTKLSIRRIFFIAGSLFLVGTLASAFASGIGWLIAARLVAGMGYGGIVINGSNLVVASTTDRNRSTGFGSWSAGFAAATICAISVGGVIVNRLGYQVGILIATGVALCLLALVAFYVPPSEPKKRRVSALKGSTAGGGASGRSAPRGEGLLSLLRIYRNRSILMNLLFSSIPFSLAYVGIFQYILPLYMGHSGISAADTGRLLTVYGLISLATPLISRLADRKRNEKTIIVTGNVITGLSLVAFFVAITFFGSLSPYILLALVLFGMGFGGMMIDASEESFLTSAREAEELGEANFLGIYATFEKVTSIAVPLVAGLLVATLGFSGSIGVIGAFTLAGAGIFAVLASNLRSKA
ncbi:MAG: MFS transporter [Spirochaetota bacterium]